jgi:hypothetical protein
MDSRYRCVLRVASYESNAENAVFDLNPKPETRNA